MGQCRAVVMDSLVLMGHKFNHGSEHLLKCCQYVSVIVARIQTRTSLTGAQLEVFHCKDNLKLYPTIFICVMTSPATGTRELSDDVYTNDMMLLQQKHLGSKF